MNETSAATGKLVVNRAMSLDGRSVSPRRRAVTV
jgi:hypothetical protein